VLIDLPAGTGWGSIAADKAGSAGCGDPSRPITRVPKEVILASHQAFLAAGGKAKLVLVPPLQGDGHFVYRVPKLWYDELRAYLVGRGFTIGTSTAPAAETGGEQRKQR
jgi:hypothetical protein